MAFPHSIRRTPLPESALYDEGDVVGKLRVQLLPEGLTRAEFDLWWPRLSQQERDRYPVVYETKNIVTQNGRTQILTYIGNGSINSGLIGNIAPFNQYFAVGTSPIATLSAGDVVVAGELFRTTPSSAVISGNSVSISIFFGSTQANGTYTNAGFFGVNATSTPGSGTLMTHALYSFTKTNGQTLTTTYIISVN